MGQRSSNLERKDSLVTSHTSESRSSRSGKHSREDESRSLREEIASLKQQIREQSDRLAQVRRDNRRLQVSLDSRSNIGRNNTSKRIVTKKCGVSGESSDVNDQAWDLPIAKVEKDFRSKELIKDALLDNSMLKNFLDHRQLNLIVGAMSEQEYTKNSTLCQEGAIGNHLFVIADGFCNVSVASFSAPKTKRIGPGSAFGELALLYNCPRTATVTAATDVSVWVLHRRTFQTIMMKTGKDRRKRYNSFLRCLPLLQNVSEELIGKIVDSVQIERFSAGEYICRQGSYGDTFYIISEGSVRISQEVKNSSSDNSCSNEERELRHLSKGDYFGERALLSPGSSCRTASVVSEGCECLVLDKTNFFSLIGDLDELRGNNYAIDTREENDERRLSEASDDIVIQGMELSELERLTTLGVGGFGRVSLVRWKRGDTSRVFALKACSKDFVRISQQEQHVHNEKMVQKIASRHQFITKLFRTFRDSSHIYFLMEPCLGGELWTLLKNRGSFSEETTKFFVASVIEAIQFLHSQRILYRDLKPENCLLDREGYLKLTDFGFSKILKPGEKTWTFCGTPEYVPPEVILNKGHDTALDFWSIGILMFELLTGAPPFQTSDPLQTYNLILRGFDAIGFDENIFRLLSELMSYGRITIVTLYNSKHSINLIKRLCRESPSERIGVQKNEFRDLKRHKWFSNFDWEQLVKRQLQPPIIPKLESDTDHHLFEVNPHDDITHDDNGCQGQKDWKESYEYDWFEEF